MTIALSVAAISRQGHYLPPYLVNQQTVQHSIHSNISQPCIIQAFNWGRNQSYAAIINHRQQIVDGWWLGASYSQTMADINIPANHKSKLRLALIQSHIHGIGTCQAVHIPPGC